MEESIRYTQFSQQYRLFMAVTIEEINMKNKESVERVGVQVPRLFFLVTYYFTKLNFSFVSDRFLTPGNE